MKNFFKEISADFFSEIWTFVGLFSAWLVLTGSAKTVIGKVTYTQHEWMNEDNGVWVSDTNMICDFIADFIQNWLEDNIKPELYDNMKKTVENYTNKQEFDSSVTSLFEEYLNVRANSFEEQISKTEE